MVQYRRIYTDYVKTERSGGNDGQRTAHHGSAGREKMNFGKKTMGVVRTTYLIDEDGLIVRAMSKVKAAENPGQMLGALAVDAAGNE